MTETLGGILANRKPDEQRQCDTHGDYVSKNILGDHWSGCPVCAEENKKIEEEQKKKRRN